jgi:hypothetical membrane protein
LDVAATDAETPGTVAWLSRLTLIGISIYVVLDVVAQALPPHYSPISQAESDLAVGPNGWIMTLNFVVRGLLSAALFTALWRVVPASPRARLGFSLAGVWTVGAFLLAAFPTDVGGSEHTTHGKLHFVVALLAFVAIPIAERLLSTSLEDQPGKRGPGNRLALLANLSGLGFVVLLLGARVPAISGLAERIFLTSVLLWMLVAALGLRRESRSRTIL